MLNIKNPEAHRLAQELAALEGCTLTEAVTSALRSALEEHLRHASVRRQILEGLVASARASELTPSASDFEDLYDETGLPA